MKIAFHLGLTFLALAVTGCGSDTEPKIEGISSYLEKLGYSFYNPPRIDRGPASVFRFKKAHSGSVVISPVCNSLFPDITIESTAISIPAESSRESVSFDIGLELLRGLFKSQPNLGFNNNQNMDIEVKFEGAKAISISEESLFNLDGKAKTITPSCYSALKKISERGSIKDVFIVQESISIDKMTYSLDQLFGASLEAAAKFKGAVDANAGIQYQINKDNNLIVESPRYIAFKAFAIDSYVETGLTTYGSVVLQASPINVTEQLKIRN
ncbi:hypothetical protein ACSLBF_06920 [Pseudoalteromonas sp. T1lg65]|uniref:hypothetical protein n=1 Tax=Pseudoalteromonas sp. T1lg65 TaxID=2077101 RepID=UPI003F7AFC87